MREMVNLNMVWHSSAPEEKVEEYLSRYKEYPLTLEVEIEFRSYSREWYKYVYELHINTKEGEDKPYYVKKTLLKKAELPWGKGFWNSFKHIFFH